MLVVGEKRVTSGVALYRVELCPVQGGSSFLDVSQHSGTIPLGATERRDARASVKNILEKRAARVAKKVPSERYSKWPERAGGVILV